MLFWWTSCCYIVVVLFSSCANCKSIYTQVLHFQRLREASPKPKLFFMQVARWSLLIAPAWLVWLNPAHMLQQCSSRLRQLWGYRLQKPAQMRKHTGCWPEDWGRLNPHLYHHWLLYCCYQKDRLRQANYWRGRSVKDANSCWQHVLKQRIPHTDISISYEAVHAYRSVYNTGSK